MNDFSKVRFKGTFRDYQARVLQNANTHLQPREAAKLYSDLS